MRKGTLRWILNDNVVKETLLVKHIGNAEKSGVGFQLEISTCHTTLELAYVIRAVGISYVPGLSIIIFFQLALTRLRQWVAGKSGVKWVIEPHRAGSSSVLPRSVALLDFRQVLKSSR